MKFKALFVNTTTADDDDDYKPHEIFNNVHPVVFKMYMESLADSVPEMEDMLELFNMYWDHVKAGICEYNRVMYCYCLNEAHNVLMDLYFGDQQKIKMAEPFLIEKQNEMFPLETIDELRWAEETIFQVHWKVPPEDFTENWTEPYDMVKDNIVPVALLEYMESRPDMEELLTLYKFYWKYRRSGRCVDELARFCGFLLEAFTIVFNLYFTGPGINIEAVMPSLLEIQDRLNSDLSWPDNDVFSTM
ncbi:uncharacterized protein LOC126839582 isoform X2 [Adelges cooleyi]|uniref:uncharacterized protein LOC126839582 isoform X2 n=1 Tax=Adelges cooleyi TaxID=133065 RepID=UPI00218065B7|nr:uncharacterized protein LOC126839582 isoform X2 [Adelges cooleyi]